MEYNIQIYICFEQRNQKPLKIAKKKTVCARTLVQRVKKKQFKARIWIDMDV